MPARKQPEPDTTMRFTLEGKAYEIDPETLEWGEIEQLEIYFDSPYDQVDFESMRAMMFLLYLARRRQQPDFTLDQMRALKLSDLTEDDEATPRPTDTAPAASGTPT